MILASALAISIGLFPGLVEKASKSATAGAIDATKEKVNTGEAEKAVKHVTQGVITGVANEVPKVTSQIYNQTAKDKEQLGAVAGQVASDATKGALDETFGALSTQLGENGNGPLAKTLSATTEQITASAVRGMRSEIHIAGLAIAFCLGAISTLVCGALLALILVLVWRRHSAETNIRGDVGVPAVARR